MAGFKKTLITKILNNVCFCDNNRSILTKYSKGAAWLLQSEYKINKIKLETWKRSLKILEKNHD